MFNPDTKLNEPYAERWRRLEIPSGSETVILESDDDTDDKAFIGRVGPWAISLSKSATGSFLARRQVLAEDSRTWEAVYEIGDTHGLSGLPVLPVSCQGPDYDNWREGGRVHYGGRWWAVREHSLVE
jgi:hypothetical protein